MGAGLLSNAYVCEQTTKGTHMAQNTGTTGRGHASGHMGQTRREATEAVVETRSNTLPQVGDSGTVYITL